MLAADVVVVVAGIDFKAVEVDANGGAAVEQRGASELAPVDFGGENPWIMGKPVAAVGEIESEFAPRIVG